MFKFRFTMANSACVLLGLLLMSTGVHAAKKPLIFGVHPYLHPAALIERFIPFTEYLEEGMNTSIQIRVGTSYADHIQAFERGEIDFAYFGPASFIKLTQDNESFRPLGRLSFSGKDTFRGAIVIRQGSELKSLSELTGKRFAFGDPNSTLSNLVPQKMLEDAGVKLEDLSSYSNLKNHHNVALAVLLDKYDAGGVKSEVFQEFEPRGLKVLQWTPDIPTHLFVANSNLSEAQFIQLSQLMQSLHEHEKAEKILSNIKKGTTAIIPAYTQEYQALRELITPRVN